MFEQTVGVFAEAAVGRTPRRLHVRDVPVRRAQHAQERLGVHGARAHFDIERLLNDAASGAPEFLQLENEILKRHSRSGPISLNTRAERKSFSRCMAISRRCAASSSRAALLPSRSVPTAAGGVSPACRRNSSASADMPNDAMSG